MNGIDANPIVDWLSENVVPLNISKTRTKTFTYAEGKNLGWYIWTRLHWDSITGRHTGWDTFVYIDGRKCRGGGLTAFKLKFGGM